MKRKLKYTESGNFKVMIHFLSEIITQSLHLMSQIREELMSESDDDYYPMDYIAPEEGSHVRKSIPTTHLFDHVERMSMNANHGYEEEYQVSGKEN